MSADYTVYCHRCLRPAGSHRRSTSTLIGSPTYGALWHCPMHADCPDCPRGSWSDPHTPRRHGWPRKVAPIV